MLTGCAKYWYQQGQSFQQTRKDLASCQSEAIRYSDVERTHGLGSYERHFVENCMHEKGYRLVFPGIRHSGGRRHHRLRGHRHACMGPGWRWWSAYWATSRAGIPLDRPS